MIQIENLVKNYKDLQVLKGLSLSVGKGEVYGFIGHNDAGKSTTMNILSGLIRFQSGRCIVNGKDISKHRHQIIREVGYLPEDPKFYPYMTAREYLALTGRIDGRTKEEIRNRSDYLLEITSLKHAADRRIGGYSRGMRQRMGLAVTLYHDPPILLLDEPSSALDPEGRKEVVSIIERVKQEGKTVFLSTHILSDIERICNRIGMLQGGKLILEGDINSLMRDYMLPVYDIEFANKLSNEEFEKLTNLLFVKEVQQKDHKLSVFIEPTEENNIALLRYIADLGFPVHSYTLRKSSLEEIFLRLVKIDE